MMKEFDGDDPERMRSFFGPSQIDSQLRSLISTCWMMLPEDKKTVDECERQFRRLVDRALKDLRDDNQAFGLPG